MSCPRDQDPGRSNRVSVHRRALYAILLVVLVIASIEIASRLYLKIQFDASLAHPGTSLHRFYPQLANLETIHRQSNDKTFNVLLLGASVVEQLVGPLTRRLADATSMPVKVVNFAVSAHTSRDSLFKYRHLADANFDLVIVYHAINDVRANNISQAAYRDDYSHFAWYATINVFEDSDPMLPGAAPRVLTLALHETKVRLGWIKTLPMTRVRADAFQHGRSIKTADAFRRNLEEIVTLASDAKSEVALLTFASHLPAEYSIERFRAGQLDYEPTKHFGLPAELWGAPRNVAAGIRAHNEVIVDIASRFDNVLFIDQQRLIPQDGRYFVDICHLSPAGVALFVDNIMAVITPLLESAERKAATGG